MTESIQIASQAPSGRSAHLPSSGRRIPVSTYRLQLGPDLSFDQAAAQLDYLDDLGITDLYLSPILQAAPGSTHGYDVVDPTTINPAIARPNSTIADITLPNNVRPHHATPAPI